MTHFVELLLINMRHRLEMVLQDGLHTGQRGVSGPLTQTIDGGMQALATTQYGSQHIAHGQIVVVVCMEIKMDIRVAFHHLTHVADELQRIENAQCIGQHDATDADILQTIHQLEDILRRILHAITPILQIEIDRESTLQRHLHVGLNISQMLLRRLLQLLCTVAVRPLGKQVDDMTASILNPLEGFAIIHKAQHLYPIQVAML